MAAAPVEETNSIRTFYISPDLNLLWKNILNVMEYKYKPSKEFHIIPLGYSRITRWSYTIAFTISNSDVRQLTKTSSKVAHRLKEFHSECLGCGSESVSEFLWQLLL